MNDAFEQIPMDNDNVYSLVCPRCNHVTEKRRDSFLPGAHVVICKNFQGECGYATTAVILLGGEKREVTAESHRGGGI